MRELSFGKIKFYVPEFISDFKSEENELYLM